VPASWLTLAENGLAVDSVLWNGLFAPAAIVARLANEVTRIMREEPVRKRLNDAGIEPEPIS
jgi:tripartite-type tricarboxylate transporter receptor subunit TctC